MKLLELTGLRFGRLIAKEYVGNSNWLCACDCGNSTVVQGADLKAGKTRSCWCFRRESVKARATTHGLRRTQEYELWLAMKKRCSWKKHAGYAIYGGRGIRVCKKWINNFPAFLKDMGLRPTPKHTVDRKNSDGNYTPSNCRWATTKEQNRNRRNAIFLTWRGEKKLLIEWAESLGFSYETLYNRLKCYGWTVGRALSTPVRS